jgi:hypothetical protein
MSAGEVSSYPRNSWDLAVRTRIMSSSIITNDGTGVVLYTYPKADTSGWATFDTSGYKTWKPMFNDQDDWENGAFSRNATGGLDFGWGVYNTTTHHITGDSLFLVQLRDGSFRKVWIVVKKAGDDLVTFRYANIDGTGQRDVLLDCNNYLAKDFIGYSLITHEIVDYQPNLQEWDIVFTKYMSVQEGLTGSDTVYPVTGILSNEEVSSEKFTGVGPDFIAYDPAGWDSTRASIGYDWKTFTGSAFVIPDSTTYFVKTKAGDIYKLVFEKFTGSGGGGKVIFSKGLVPGVGINEYAEAESVMVYPNPVKDQVEIVFPSEISGLITLQLCDLSGRTIDQKNIRVDGKIYKTNLSGISPGVYLLKIFSGKGSYIRKVVVSG